jgi:hypothetical protein
MELEDIFHLPLERSEPDKPFGKSYCAQPGRFLASSIRGCGVPRTQSSPVFRTVSRDGKEEDLLHNRAIEARDGLCFQNGRPPKHSPRDQAHGYLDKLIRRLRNRGTPAPAHGIATWSPDTPVDEADRL